MAALEATTYTFTLLLDAPKLQLLLTGLCLAAALLVGAVVIALVNRWRRQSEATEDLSPSAQLAHFRSLYEAGTISQEEFDRLRAFLGGQMRETLGVPAPPPPETPAKPPPEQGEQPPNNPETGIRPA
ncbi:MAG TPA: SHOCT domain-containing protein [Gemmataceae bacterium]